MAKDLLSRCPVCGRTLYVPEQLYGDLVRCGHCHATFTAGAPSVAGSADASCAIFEHVDQLLRMTEQEPATA